MARRRGKDEPEPWAILREEGEYVANLKEGFELPPRGRECRFFKPYAGGETPGTPDYQKYGKQDFESIEAMQRGEWWFVYIYATAEVVIGGVTQTIRSGGEGRVPSNCPEDILLVDGEQEMELRAILNIMGIENAGAKVVEVS